MPGQLQKRSAQPVAGSSLTNTGHRRKKSSGSSLDHHIRLAASIDHQYVGLYTQFLHLGQPNKYNYIIYIYTLLTEHDVVEVSVFPVF